MTLGPVESITPATAVAPLLMPLAQAGGAAENTGAVLMLEPVLAPVIVLVLCIAAGVGTFLLLPRRGGGGAQRSVGGAMVLLAALVLGLVLVRYIAINNWGAGPGIYFWIFSAIALLGALRVVTHPRPVYAALYFVLTVFASAGLFVLLWAEFMAAALVLIYAGAILVTYVFVIMLAASTAQAGLSKMAEYDEVSRDPVVAASVGFALMGVLLFVIFDRAEPVSSAARTYTYVAWKVEPDGRRVEVSGEVEAPNVMVARERVPLELRSQLDRDPEPAFSVQALGRYLFREQAVNLELSGLILTIGMVGAILIARRRVMVAPQVAREKETFTAPATPISDDPFSIPVYGTDNPRQKAYPET